MAGAVTTRQVTTDGFTYWIAWDQDGLYEMAPTEDLAVFRLTEPIDYRFLMLTYFAKNAFPRVGMSDTQNTFLDSFVLQIQGGLPIINYRPTTGGIVGED